MLKQDAYYRMGHAHKVCEDYALQGTVPFPWLIVCDGCSSSLHTDVGARILAHIAARHLQDCKNALDYKGFGQAVIEQAYQHTQSLRLPPACLDATLLLARQQDESVQVWLYGDGHILLKDAAQAVSLISVEFKGNAPYYLSYLLDAQHQQAYRDSFPDPHILSVQHSNSPEIQYRPYHSSLEFSFKLNEYSMIGIASDGLSSFIQLEEQRLLPALDMAQTLMDFKHLHPDFVQRRMTKSLTRLLQQNIVPFDDVSMGVFAVDEI